MAKPAAVSEAEWETAIAEQLSREKALTKTADVVTAMRQRMPMTKVDPSYRFEGPDGELSFAELFSGRPQLVVYSAMLRPDQPDFICPGCSMIADNLPHLAHVRARDITFVFASRVPQAQIDRVKERMDWPALPWVTCEERFAADVGALVDGHDTFRITVFFKDGDDIYKTYATAGRGGERFGSYWGIVDSTPFGRQEEWQDVPEGWPQGPTYDDRTRLHTDYDRDEPRPGRDARRVGRPSS